jgi:uncharacterized protein involved in exopolysaccharide biosynthesis
MEERPERNRILYNILWVIFKRKVLLIILSIISFALIIFFTFLTTPLYKATAKILIRPNPQQQLILFRDLATPGEEIARINPASNLMQILTSQEMAQKVVKKFRLHEKLRKKAEEPEALRDKIKRFLSTRLRYPITVVKKMANLEEKEENYVAAAVDILMEDTEDIQLEEATSIINLSIWEGSPKLCSDIANYMAECLIISSKELEQSTAGNVYDFTKEQVKLAERTLSHSEDELLRFKTKENIISLEEQKSAKLDELHKLEDQYIDVKVTLSETRARFDQMQSEIYQQKQLLSNPAIVANNPVLTALKTSLYNLEVQLSGELQKYTKSSKNVESLKAQATESKERLQRELKMITESDLAILYSIHSDLPNEYIQLITNIVALEAKKGELEKEIDTLKAEAFSLSVKETELERLTRRTETNEKLYKTLLDKFSELQVQKASQISGYDLKIIDRAFIPEDARPDQPKWLLVIPLGFIGSLLLSFATVFFIEYWDETFKSPSEIEDRLALSVLCTLPDIRI